MYKIVHTISLSTDEHKKTSEQPNKLVKTILQDGVGEAKSVILSLQIQGWDFRVKSSKLHL